MKKTLFLSGNEAVAYGVKLVKPDVIAAYPITPQTVVVEKLSEMVEKGELNSTYLHVESEHSALSACMGAVLTGARTFTATSSQGLLYMAECLHYASGGRMPIVMMNANRSLALPWSIFGDQRDSLSMLDSGWIQVYVEDAQEALDMVIQAYRIAEDENILTPVMINLDGFVLTHTYESVEIPDNEVVRKYLPDFNFRYRMNFETPLNIGFSTTPAENQIFKIQQHRAVCESKNIIAEADREFGALTGRYYNGLIDTYKIEDAEYVFVTAGSLTGTVRSVVDTLRAAGEKAGLIKLRFLRPFPYEELACIINGKKGAAVIEKDISFGYEGTIFTNVNSALSRLHNPPTVTNFVGGLGGRNISAGDIEEVYFTMKNGDEVGRDRVVFVNPGAQL